MEQCRKAKGGGQLSSFLKDEKKIAMKRSKVQTQGTAGGVGSIPIHDSFTQTPPPPLNHDEL